MVNSFHKKVASKRSQTTGKKSRVREKNLFRKEERAGAFDHVPADYLGLTSHALVELYEKAIALLELREIKESLKIFNLLTLLHPYSSDFWYGLGQVLREDGGVQEALKAYAMAEMIDPDCLDIYEEEIDCCLALQKDEEACRVYKRMLLHKKTIVDFEERKDEVKDIEKVLFLK